MSEFGVVITGSDGRIQGFQEKPDPAEALSDLANCMIYVLEPEIFDYFPDQPVVDFALDVFPALLEHDVPFYVHEIDAYWNDVGSLPEYLQGNLDARRGRGGRRAGGRAARARRVARRRSSAAMPGVGGRVLAARRAARSTPAARLDGPLVIGAGSRDRRRGAGQGVGASCPGARRARRARSSPGAVYGRAAQPDPA